MWSLCQIFLLCFCTIFFFLNEGIRKSPLCYYFSVKVKRIDIYWVSSTFRKTLKYCISGILKTCSWIPVWHHCPKIIWFLTHKPFYIKKYASVCVNVGDKLAKKKRNQQFCMTENPFGWQLKAIWHYITTRVIAYNFNLFIGLVERPQKTLESYTAG